MNRFQELGLTLDELKTMDPQTVETAFYPPENLRRSEKPMPDFFRIHNRMMAMKYPNLAFLWLEYKEEHPDGYQLTQFYEHYRTFLAENFGQESVTMPVERIPGERMYIDWVGDKPELLTNPSTGEIKSVHVFTTTLGFSSCVYAEIFPDEKLPHFITGVVHALEFYGAVPKYLVPDNLKTAITKNSKDELILQSVFSDLEDFYDTIVLPPPPRKPKGKPTVENHVRFLETHLIERLKENTYTSLDALNKKTQKIIAAINQGVFQNRHDIRRTRQHAFETYDRPKMKSLPHGSFTVSEIRICDENNRLLTTHSRSYKDFPRYITKEEHMPPEHQYYRELNAHDGAYYRRWASTYGEAMSIMIDRVLRSAKHEEQAYNSCKGILHMCSEIPRHIVEEAAQACIDANACRYTYFKKALSLITNHKRTDSWAGQLPEHENIRGRDSYQ